MENRDLRIAAECFEDCETNDRDAKGRFSAREFASERAEAERLEKEGLYLGLQKLVEAIRDIDSRLQDIEKQI